MTERPPVPRAERATKRYVRARIKYWRHRLGLAHWAFEIQFGPDKDGGSAGCEAEPEYRQATLSFDLSLIHRDHIDRFVVHELVHCFVWGLANVAQTMARGNPALEEWVRTEEERLTTELEYLVLSLSQGATSG